MMCRIADLVQVFQELAEPPLLQPNIHLQRVIRGGSADFNPACGNVDPFVFHLELLPTLVELEWFRNRRPEGTKQSDSPE